MRFFKDIKSIIVGKICYETFPCQHDVKIIYYNGKERNQAIPFTILLFLASINDIQLPHRNRMNKDFNILFILYTLIWAIFAAYLSIPPNTYVLFPFKLVYYYISIVCRTLCKMIEQELIKLEN